MTLKQVEIRYDTFDMKHMTNVNSRLHIIEV